MERVISVSGREKGVRLDQAWHDAMAERRAARQDPDDDGSRFLAADAAEQAAYNALVEFGANGLNYTEIDPRQRRDDEEGGL